MGTYLELNGDFGRNFRLLDVASGMFSITRKTSVVVDRRPGFGCCSADF
jgi:hypothetical protein